MTWIRKQTNRNPFLAEFYELEKYQLDFSNALVLLHFLFSRAIFFPIFSCRLPSLFLSPFSFFLFSLPPGRVRRVELFFNSSKWKRTRFRVINEVKFIEQRRKIIHAPHSRPRGVKILLIMFLVKRPARDTRSNELGIRIHPKSFS